MIDCHQSICGVPVPAAIWTRVSESDPSYIGDSSTGPSSAQQGVTGFTRWRNGHQLRGLRRTCLSSSSSSGNIISTTTAAVVGFLLSSGGRDRPLGRRLRMSKDVVGQACPAVVAGVSTTGCAQVRSRTTPAAARIWLEASGRDDDNCST